MYEGIILNTLIAIYSKKKEKIMKLRPVYDNVVVRRKDETKITKGGLHIPGTATEKPMEGEVLAVGEGKPLENGAFLKPPVKVGDRILFRRYSDSEVTYESSKDVTEIVVLVRTTDIIGVLE